MSLQKKQQKYFSSRKKLLEIGIETEESKPQELPQVIADTMWSPYPIWTRPQKPLFSIAELVRPSNETILTDRPTIFSLFFPQELFTKKLGQDLIINEKSLSPFWTKSYQEMSDNWWLHIKTDWLDSEWNFLSGYSQNIIVNSWFSTGVTCLQNEKWLKISSPLSTSLVAGCTDSENIKIKSKRIRIYPDKFVRIAYRKWLSAARWSYNKAIAYLRNCWQKKEKLPRKYELRKILTNLSPEWVKSTPFNPRGAAILDAFVAFKKTTDKLQPRFRSCREPRQSLKLQSGNFSKGITYPRELGKYQLNPSEPLPEQINSDFSIVLDHGRWFICYPQNYEIKPHLKNNAIALDPGVRTFITGFDGNNILQFGIKDFSRITILCLRLDKIQSQISLAKGRKFKRKRWQLRKVACRLRVKITNLVNELHNQTASYLTCAYKHIFLPTFETSQMVNKKKRKLHSKTARAMLSWCHYRFKQTLKFHAQKRGSIVHNVTEEYTSKTCSKCGHVHHKLGGNKKFNCPNCGQKIDRDWNGAINILNKSLHELVYTSSELDDTRYTVEFTTSW
jgi:putative transposase